MAVSSYALYSDVFGTAGYLRDPSSSANQSIMTTILAAASREIDYESGQIFYDDGAYQMRVDSIGGNQITTSLPFFMSAGTIDAASAGATTLQYTTSTFAPRVPVANEAMVIDVGATREVVTPSVVGAISGGKYPLTVPATSFAHGAASVATTLQIKLAYFENMPQAQWILELDGDGWNPPSNYYLWPSSVRRIGAANQSTPDTTSTRPWMDIELPTIPISNTTWLPTVMPGKATVLITAHWGWPVVPDFIKDLTCRAAAVGWRMRQSGQTSGQGARSGSAAVGITGIGAMRALIRQELTGSIYKLVYV